MKRKWQVGILLFLALTVAFMPYGPWAAPATAQGDGEGILIGRISHVEGQLLRYVMADKDWIATIKDTPFGFNDTLYSGSDGRAEFIMPNNTWVRIGGSTQIQLISLKSDVTAVDVASGVARFYNRSSDTVVKATTPYGSIVAEPGAAFDLYAGDESIEVIGIKGQVSFVRDSDQSRFDVAAGSSSIIASEQGVYAGQGNIDSGWDDWNATRDSAWTKRLQVKGASVKYVNEALADETYELDQQGSWEEVNYEGHPRHLWRPTHVRQGWAPFTDGKWSVYHEDQTWVPSESFGYVTHHYGNWVRVNDAWYWSPPPPRAEVSVGVHVAPGVNVGVNVGGGAAVGLGWNPGRVAWVHSGESVGWVPLAPQEPYYAHHSWGSAVTVAAGVGAVSLSIGSYRYLDQAVVVKQDNFYRATNYNDVRVTNINKTTIINNYQAAPVVNNTVINNYNNIKERYNYTNVVVDKKPHQEVLGRIERNQTVAKEVGRMDAKAIQATAQKGKPIVAASAPAQIASPKVTSKLVKPEDMAKPKNEVQFQKQDVKTKVKPVAESPATKMTFPAAKEGKPAKEAKPGEPAKPGAPGAAPEKAAPPKPGQELKPGEAGKPVPPGKELKPGEAVKPVPPGAAPGMAAPPKPGQELKPGEAGKPVPPGKELKPGEAVKPVPPGAAPGMAAPPRPGQELKPGEAGKPVPPGKELKPGEAVKPVPPGAAPGMAAPPRPGQELKPGEAGKPVAPGKELKPGEAVKPVPHGKELKPGEPAKPVPPGAAPGMAAPPRPGQEMRPAQPGKPGEPGRATPPLREEKPGREMRPAAPPSQPGGREMRPAEPAAPRQQPGADVKSQPKSPAEAPQRGVPSRPAPEMRTPGQPSAPAGREMRPAAPPSQPGGREMKPAEPAAPKHPGSQPQMKEQSKPSHGPAQPAPAGAAQPQTDKDKKKKPGQEGQQPN